MSNFKKIKFISLRKSSQDQAMLYYPLETSFSKKKMKDISNVLIEIQLTSETFVIYNKKRAIISQRIPEDHEVS